MIIQDTRYANDIYLPASRLAGREDTPSLLFPNSPGATSSIFDSCSVRAYPKSVAFCFSFPFRLFSTKVFSPVKGFRPV